MFLKSQEPRTSRGATAVGGTRTHLLSHPGRAGGLSPLQDRGCMGQGSRSEVKSSPVQIRLARPEKARGVSHVTVFRYTSIVDRPRSRLRDRLVKA